jgi:glycine/D-amino acid oxidase-like deaminating enzyme
MQLSYWEKHTFFSHIDIGIIGGGLIGMCTALYLKLARPSLKIAIFERGTLPYGASTRNAGFACVGSLGELLDDNTTEHEDIIADRVRLRYEGLKKLRNLIGDQNMDYHHWGGYEIFTDTNIEDYHKCMSAIRKWNEIFYDITGINETFTLDDKIADACGFRGVRHVIKNHAEGQLDTGMLMHTLINRCHREGILIFNGITIDKWQVSMGKPSLQIGSSHIPCNKIIFCNNAFAKQMLPELDIHPARAQVLVTSPIENLRVNGAFHFQQGYYYFRNIHGRILIGGGRNLDRAGETTYTFGTSSMIMNSLHELLAQIILPHIHYTIEQEWSGIMAMGSNKTPIIRKVASNVYAAVRMGGMGIAIGAMVADEVSKIVLNDM